MRNECDNLEAYLGDGLIGVERARFAAHADRCAECREAIEVQRWIDALLRSPLRAELESPPAPLIEAMHDATRTQRTSTGARRRRRVIASVAATAAVVLIAAGWIVVSEFGNGPGEKQLAETIAAAAKVEPQKPAAIDEQQLVSASDSPRASFVGTGDTIAVPVESEAPDVTIVRLYSVYRPAISTSVVAGHEPVIRDFNQSMNN